jgi:hypothetical protein
LRRVLFDLELTNNDVKILGGILAQIEFESEEPFVLILQVADPKLLWDSQHQEIPRAELAKFNGPVGVGGVSGPWEFNGADVLERTSRYPILSVVLPSQGSASVSYAFRADGKAFLAKGEPGGPIRIWSLDGDFYAQMLCKRLWQAYDFYPIGWTPERYRRLCGNPG